MPAAGIGQQKGLNFSPLQSPTSPHITNTSKVEQIELQSFASSAIFTCPLTNLLPLLQASQHLFTGKMLPKPAEGRKGFARVVKSQGTDFCITGINKLISHWPKCIDCNGSYFD